MAKHFDDNGNEIRCVYLVMFEQDGYCYIGTTNDYDRRIGDHLFNDRHSEVFQHKRHTGFIPEFTMLHDYTSIEEANKLEYYYTIEYAKLGKKILNVQKPGGYGHKEAKVIGKITANHVVSSNIPTDNNNTHFTSLHRTKRKSSIFIKKAHIILATLCKRANNEGGERIYIRQRDITKPFENIEMNSCVNKRLHFCSIGYVYYLGENKDMSYMICSDIDEKIADSIVSCQRDKQEQLNKIYDSVYKKCYVFKKTETIKGYLDKNLDIIDNEITLHLLNHNITAPFNKSVEIEKFGYREDMLCSRTDYAVMLNHIQGFCSPSFDVNFDKNWNLSCLFLSISYNSYSMWAKRYDAYEMQDVKKRARFKELVEKIDNYIYSVQDSIQDYPQRIEFYAKDLNLENIDLLRSFMRHFYVCHGTAWDINGGDSCICSVENYNGKNMNGCKFIIEIQGDQFFLFYDLEKHVLDESNSFIKQ